MTTQSTLVPPRRHQAVPPAPVHPAQRAVRLTRSGWAPAGLTAAGTAAILHDVGVPVHQMAIFAAYIAIGVVLPGMLLWRAVHGGSRHIAEDLAAGAAVGYALEVLSYIAARWTGHPLLFLVWPAATLAAFAAVPRLRRHWRGSGLRAPAWSSWVVSAMTGLVVLASGTWVFRTHGPHWPANAHQDPHMLFNLAIIGELKHHMPPVIPWVQGEPLYYHWFIYADMAATGWVTGIDAPTLLYRLSMVPVIAASVVLLAAIARRLTGCWWSGPAVLAITYLAISPIPAQWATSVEAMYLAQATAYMWMGPSQPFGAMIFAATMLVAIELLRGTGRGRALWPLVCVLLAAVMGAKAIFLPLLLAGLVTTIAVQLAGRRRVGAAVLALTGIVVAFVVFAQLVFFGGAAQGMTVDPGAFLRFLAPDIIPGTEPTGAVIGFMTVVLLLGWACVWAGLAGLFRRPRMLLDPVTTTLLGIGAAGIGAMLVFSQYGMSQVYFTRGGNPYLAVAAVCGLAALLPARFTVRGRAVLLVAGCVGVGLAVAFGALDGGFGDRVDDPVTLPLLLAATGCVAVVTIVLGRRSVTLRSVTAAAVIVLFTALAGPSTARQTLVLVQRAGAWHAAPSAAHAVVPKGAFPVARWLREHSGPGDLVATNAHCYQVSEPRCDNRHFWVAALTERHVLVEGWGYTETANRGAVPHTYPYVPYWNRPLLAANDAVFTEPSAQAVTRLREEYGVRWLFADDRVKGISPRIGEFATLRVRHGHCAVYEITG